MKANELVTVEEPLTTVAAGIRLVAINFLRAFIFAISSGLSGS